MTNIKNLSKELLGNTLNSFHRKIGIQQIEESNKSQDVVLDTVLKSFNDGYTLKTEQSNVMHLEGSGDGVVELIDIEGQTLVNSCENGDIEYIANDEISLEGTDITINDTVEGGLVDVALEGETLVNVCNQKDPVAITKSYTVENTNHVPLQGEYDGKCRPVLEGRTLVNYCNNGNTLMGLNKEINATGSGMITINETIDNGLVDVELSGKTLVNVFNLDKMSWNAGTTLENGVITLTNPPSGWSTFDTELSTIKPNTQYTLIVNLIENTTNESVIIHNRDETNGYFKNFSWKGKNDLGVSSYLLTTVDDVTNKKYSIRTKTKTEGQYVKLQILLLEGDHTDKDLNFFEGLKSVGQGVNGEVEDIVLESINGGIDNSQNEFIEINLSTGNIASVNNTICTGINHISTDRNVALYKNGEKLPVTISKRYYTKDKKYLGSVLTDNAYFVRFRCINDSYVNSSEGLHVYEFRNDVVPTKSNKKPLLYFNPNTQTWEKPILREWDSIEKHSDGKYYYHKRSGEVVLGDKLNVSIPSLNGEFLRYDIQLNANSSAGVICDRFIYDKNTLKEKITHINDALLVVFIDKSKIASQDVQGFKQWLQTNNVTVVYKLAQEEVYECTNLDLITYPNETNLIVNSGAIQPKITLKVLSNVSNVVKLLQEKVSVLENKFINGLKQVLAGYMMSLAHMLYPEDFEQNEYEVKTLEEL